MEKSRGLSTNGTMRTDRDQGTSDSLAAWISQEYIANINLGDQSSNPFLQASRTAVINDPETCA